MSTEENKALVRRWLTESWRELARGTLNLDLFDELVTDDFVGHFLPPGLPRGPEGPKQSMRAVLESGTMSDTACTVEDQVAGRGPGGPRFTFSFTHTGPVLGVAATGKRVTITGINLDRVADGKVAESWAVEDLFGILQQLGAFPAPEQAPARP
jgi:hypothetical protein